MGTATSGTGAAGSRSCLMEVIESRRSVRAYADRPVDRSLIAECIEAVRFAPSACNVQPWRFLAVDEPGLRDRLAAAAFSGIYKATRFAADAPVLMVLLTRFDWFVQGAGRQIQGTQYHLLDAGIAGEHFVLRAAEFGLGTCWIGWYNRRKLRKILRIPRRYRVCAMIALGWPAEDFKSKEKLRHQAGQLISFNEISFDGE
ncbi:MAG TPA: nitroreductase family protein [Acidobacteriota bacterium]|nr:nitroreductase family protein [Acidobacteriota bacterium]